MITHPSTTTTIELVRGLLRDAVAPSLQDEQLKALAGMIDSLLQRAATRAEHEIDWMREEIEDVTAAARDVVASGSDASDLERALAELEDHRAGSLAASAVAEEYRRAGEVLARGLELSDEEGASFRAILERRLDREAEVLGEFALVARD